MSVSSNKVIMFYNSELIEEIHIAVSLQSGRLSLPQKDRQLTISASTAAATELPLSSHM